MITNLFQTRGDGSAERKAKDLQGQDQDSGVEQGVSGEEREGERKQPQGTDPTETTIEKNVFIRSAFFTRVLSSQQINDRQARLEFGQFFDIQLLKN